MNPHSRVDWNVFDKAQIDWEPNESEVSINLERILIRVSQKPNWYKYKGKPFTYTQYVHALRSKGYNIGEGNAKAI